MDDLFKPEEKRRGISMVFVAAMLIAAVAIGAVIWYLSLTPSMEVQTAKILEGALREGSPEYAELNKDIIISTDDKTVQSPMATGKISMFIHGNIRNKGSKTINVLEVSVSVVTQFNEVLRTRNVLVVPVQQTTLGPGETIPITLTFDGFNKD
ncbi:MAG: hypothetical protein ABL952_17995, partial [Pyrinomonadaceae bacterium]